MAEADIEPSRLFFWFGIRGGSRAYWAKVCPIFARWRRPTRVFQEKPFGQVFRSDKSVSDLEVAL